MKLPPEVTENVLEVWSILSEGGFVMYALAGIAIVLYTVSVSSLLYVVKGGLSSSKRRWAAWIEDPEEAKGRVGEIIRYALHGPRLSVKRVQRRFDEVYDVLVSSVDRRLILIGTLVAAAPMTGLLGTVFGMLSMFEGLSAGGGKQSMGLIASGMKEALFTTLSGLIVALPGMFMALVIREKRNKMVSVLGQLQAAITSQYFKEKI